MICSHDCGLDKEFNAVLDRLTSPHAEELHDEAQAVAEAEAREDLVTVERVEQESPLYAAALAALVDGTLPESGRRRRAVRRGTGADSISEGEESAFAASGSSPSHRRRSPVGTLHP